MDMIKFKDRYNLGEFMKFNKIFITIAILITPHAISSDTGDIRMVGSSTVYPFSAIVADLFYTNNGIAPIIEATGTGGGIKLFCDGGDKSPAIANASRAIKPSEEKSCAENDVNFIEIKIGYDGIVIARNISSGEINITPGEIFSALAKDIPEAGVLVPNPYKKWSEINPKLPDIKIRVYGQPPTSGTRDAFSELVLEQGCDIYPELKALKKTDIKRHKAVCHAIREDGVFIEAGENDNLIVQKLTTNNESFGIFGFSFLDENLDKVVAAKINGVAPDFDSISNETYPVSRPLFIYVNTDRLSQNKDLLDFVKFFVSEEVMGDDGELAYSGLIPLPKDEYDAVLISVNKL